MSNGFPLKKGDSGVDVFTLQKMLVSLGYGKPADIDGEFEEKTESMVWDFQEKHGIRMTGRADKDQTFKAIQEAYAAKKARESAERPAPLQPPPPPIKAVPGNPFDKFAFIVTLFKAAQGLVGMTEQGENDGPTIRAMLAQVGINEPASWCMAAVQFLYRGAAEKHGIEDPVKPDTAHCLTLWQATPKEKRFPAKDAQPGDIFIMSFGGGRGHTGIVKANDRNRSRLETYEGNTNNAGSREGDGFFLKEGRTARPYGSIIGVIRPLL